MDRKKKVSGVSFRELFGLANLLSLVRIPLAVIMVLLYENKAAFFALLVLAILSDALDGYAARRKGPTSLGAIMDPLCDKVFVAIILLFLLFSGRLGFLAIIVLMLRDVFTTAVFFVTLLLRKRELRSGTMKARWPGKLVTVSQFVALVWLFLGIGGFRYWLALVLVLSLVAITDYAVLMRSRLKK